MITKVRQKKWTQGINLSVLELSSLDPFPALFPSFALIPNGSISARFNVVCPPIRGESLSVPD